jgi:hypothetical protein
MELEDLKMISKKTIAATAIALSALTAAPASAGGLTIEFGYPGYHWNWQGGHGWDRGHDRDRRHEVSTREVRQMLRDRGYHNIRFANRKGRTYELTAKRNGKEYFIVVSARSGNIVERYRI